MKVLKVNQRMEDRVLIIRSDLKAILAIIRSLGRVKVIVDLGMYWDVQKVTQDYGALFSLT